MGIDNWVQINEDYKKIECRGVYGVIKDIVNNPWNNIMYFIKLQNGDNRYFSEDEFTEVKTSINEEDHEESADDYVKRFLNEHGYI